MPATATPYAAPPSAEYDNVTDWTGERQDWQVLDDRWTWPQFTQTKRVGNHRTSGAPYFGW